MSKTALEDEIAASLASVKLNSRSASRFVPLRTLLASRLCLEATTIGVKSLSDPKNYGNRISEATGTGIQVLVLVAAGPVDVQALTRALGNRSVRLVPAILLVALGGRWVLEAQFLPAEIPPLVPGTTAIAITRVAPYTPPADHSLSVEAAIVGLRDVAQVGNLQEHLAALARSFPSLVIKHASGVGNLKNRIREAMGRRPSHLLLIVPASMLHASRAALSSDLGEAHTTARFLLWTQIDRVKVERVIPAAHDKQAEQPQDRAEPTMKIQEAPMTTVGESEYRRLERVKLLHRFLPLNAMAKNLYEELLETVHRLSYDTRTLAYIKELLGSTTRTVVFLTGNAGHGKTHMCRRLLETKNEPERVLEQLHEDKGGRTLWNMEGSSLPLRVVKDLSELEPIECAADILDGLMEQTDAHVIVCANEGRLRDVVSKKPGRLGAVLGALDRSMAFGDTSSEADPSLHVINLNCQAAVTNTGGFASYVLTHFLDNQGAWNVCGKCAAQRECPIVANRLDLTLSPSANTDNSNARNALLDLVRIVEESGHVLTYREVLIFVAYLITGGLTCEEVEQRHRDGRRRDTLKRYRLVEILFDATIDEDQADGFRLMGYIKRLDPGRIALRPIDDELNRELEEKGQLGAGVFGDASIQHKSRRDREREVAAYCELIRRARRYSWLRSTPDDATRLGITRSERLGLAYHDRFRSLQEGPSPSVLVEILRQLIKGLHTIQGAVHVDSKTSFHLVDPAFGRTGSHSAVIAKSLRVKDLDLVVESEWWRHLRSGESPPVLQAVDWVDRRLLLIDRQTQQVLLPLDVAAFEFVMGAADGIVMREFHAANRRRVLTQLALLAEKGGRGSNDEIRLLFERGDGTLTIERDGTILLERN